MNSYEYRVVPAPKKGQKGKGVKGAEGRFAHALESIMNAQAAEGFEYLRSDTLPSEERSGLTGRATVFQNVLVFRRVKPAAEGTVSAPDVTDETDTETTQDTDTEDKTAEDEPTKDAHQEAAAPTLGGVSKDDPGQRAEAPKAD